MNTMIDIQTRLAKVKQICEQADISSLTEGQQLALQHCIRAARGVTPLYRQQMWGDNLITSQVLNRRTDEEGKALFDYMCIQGGPWDGAADNEPFVPGVGNIPPGRAFYSEDLTREEWDQWLADHPEDRKDFMRNDTVISRTSDRGLESTEYPVFFARDPYLVIHLDEIAKELEMAADLLGDCPLAKYLELRAKALLTGDYWDSDRAWLAVDGTPFEMSIGAYETYDDKLFGLKASFQAFIGIRDVESTATLEAYAQHALAFDEEIAAHRGFTPRGKAMPMVVVRDVYRGGMMAFGRQFTAQNLPNDRRFHEEYGTKKVFSRLMLDAKPEYILLPIAERILESKNSKLCTPEAFRRFVLAHEVCHGVGPTRVRGEGDCVRINERMKDLHTTIEEAKADTLGIDFLDYLKAIDIISQEELAESIVMLYMVFFNEFRKGFKESHARGNLIEYNWLRENGGVRYDEERGVLVINVKMSVYQLGQLAGIFMNLQEDGDYEKARHFVDEMTVVPPEIPLVLQKLDGIPYDVHPTFII